MTAKLILALLNLLAVLIQFLDRHGGGWPFQ